MKKNLLLIVLLIIIAGCNNREVLTITDLFDSQEQLSHKMLEVKDDADALLSPEILLVEGNQMLVQTANSPQLFASLDIDSESIVRTWGSVGNGPGEFLFVLDFYKDYSGKGINAWDPMSQRLSFYPFEKIFSNDTILQPTYLFGGVSATMKSYQEEFFVNVLQLNETKFLGLGNNEDKRFTLIDVEHDTKLKTGDFPPAEVKDEMPHLFKIQAYQGAIRYNQKQNKVAYLSTESEMFEIFTVNDAGLELVYGNYTSIPKCSMANIDGEGEQNIALKIERFTNGRGKGVALATSDDKIWVLYQEFEKGASDDDMDKVMSSDANKIMVFDWDGKPLKMYSLDCMVKSIEYDAQSNRLYAVKSEPDPEIVYFEL